MYNLNVNVMKILDEGHKYELDNFDNEFPSYEQKLKFIKKEPIEEGSKELKTVYNGTTNEEVIRVLIDRLFYLNSKFPCEENEQALLSLQNALTWLEIRTSRRKARNVEGKHEK